MHITTINLHGRYITALDFAGCYWIPGQTLRARAIHAHLHGDIAGNRFLGRQVLAVIVSSYRDNGKVQLRIGIWGRFVSIPLPSVTYLGTLRFSSLRPLYRFWQRALNHQPRPIYWAS